LSTTFPSGTIQASLVPTATRCIEERIRIGFHQRLVSMTIKGQVLCNILTHRSDDFVVPRRTSLASQNVDHRQSSGGLTRDRGMWNVSRTRAYEMFILKALSVLRWFAWYHRLRMVTRREHESIANVIGELLPRQRAQSACNVSMPRTRGTQPQICESI